MCINLHGRLNFFLLMIPAMSFMWLGAELMLSANEGEGLSLAEWWKWTLGLPSFVLGMMQYVFLLIGRVWDMAYSVHTLIGAIGAATTTGLLGMMFFGMDLPMAVFYSATMSFMLYLFAAPSRDISEVKKDLEDL